MATAPSNQDDTTRKRGSSRGRSTVAGRKPTATTAPASGATPPPPSSSTSSSATSGAPPSLQKLMRRYHGVVVRIAKADAARGAAGHAGGPSSLATATATATARGDDEELARLRAQQSELEDAIKAELDRRAATEQREGSGGGDDDDDETAARRRARREEWLSMVTSTELDAARIVDLIRTRCSQSKVGLNPYQAAIQRLMSPSSPLRNILLFHGVGVGKTCSAVRVAEQFRLARPDRKVLVVMHRKLEAQFRREVFDVSKLVDGHNAGCTANRYLPQDVLALMHVQGWATSEVQQYVDKVVSASYEFTGYRELYNTLHGMRDDVAEIAKQYSDRVIIVDEVHNIRGTLQRVLYPIIQHASNVRLVFMSATPMYDDPIEIVPILNNFLLNDRQPLLSPADLFTSRSTRVRRGEAAGEGAGGVPRLSKRGEATLRRLARRYVSFVRGEDPTSFPVRLWPSQSRSTRARVLVPREPHAPLYIGEYYESRASPHQQAAMRRIRESQVVADGDNTVSDDAQRNQQHKPDAEDAAARAVNAVGGDEGVTEYGRGDDEEVSYRTVQLSQACNIVYPNGATGEHGFSGSFTMHVSDGVITPMATVVPGASSSSSSKSMSTAAAATGCVDPATGLDRHAPKIAAIVDAITRGGPGVYLVVAQFMYAGVLPLVMALEHAGYRLFDRAGGEPILREAGLPSLPGAPRFALVTNMDLAGSRSRRASALRAARSKRNVNGERVRVIIGTRVASEGFDFAHVREVHILDPWYNMSRIEQITGRAVRHCAHRHLPLEHRNTTVYRHVLVDRRSGAPLTEDVETYSVAEAKLRGISAVSRVLKTSAADCELNVARFSFPMSRMEEAGVSMDIVTSQGDRLPNHVIGDREGGTGCDMGPCEYKCVGEPHPDVTRQLEHGARPGGELDADHAMEVSRYQAVVALVMRKLSPLSTAAASSSKSGGAVVGTIVPYSDIEAEVAAHLLHVDPVMLRVAIARMIIEHIPVYTASTGVARLYRLRSGYVLARVGHTVSMARAVADAGGGVRRRKLLLGAETGGSSSSSSSPASAESNGPDNSNNGEGEEEDGEDAVAHFRSITKSILGLVDTVVAAASPQRRPSLDPRIRDAVAQHVLEYEMGSSARLRALVRHAVQGAATATDDDGGRQKDKKRPRTAADDLVPALRACDVLPRCGGDVDTVYFDTFAGKWLSIASGKPAPRPPRPCDAVRRSVSHKDHVAVGVPAHVGTGITKKAAHRDGAWSPSSKTILMKLRLSALPIPPGSDDTAKGVVDGTRSLAQRRQAGNVCTTVPGGVKHIIHATRYLLARSASTPSSSDTTRDGGDMYYDVPAWLDAGTTVNLMDGGGITKKQICRVICVLLRAARHGGESLVMTHYEYTLYRMDGEWTVTDPVDDLV